MIWLVYVGILIWHNAAQYGIIPGSSKKTASQTHCEETSMPPSPQFNVVTSLCLDFGSDAGMHGATTLIKGARGDQV